MSEVHDHDRGLAHDLAEMERQLIGRRRALAMFATVGTTALVAGCGGGSAGNTGITVNPKPTPTPTPTPTATATPTPTPTATSGQCVTYAAETNGPYPADGTNTSSGPTSNALTATGVVRSDIRSSFLNSTTTAPGVPVTLTLQLANVNDGCAALAGYAVYIWHCDRNGDYSLYNVPAETWLRGVQVSDSNGRVTFTTIFPGCYAGRYPHIHFEVFSSLANATSGRYARLVSQLAMPSAACSAVYATTGYTGTSATNFSRVSLATDGIFSDNTAAQITAMTLTMTGDPTSGYTATATVGIAT